MDHIIRYLELKNQYYEKFFSITSKFLKEVEQDKWENLEFVVDNRERIINILRTFDMKIEQLFNKTKGRADELSVYRHRVKELLDRRGELGNRIIEIDLELISRMEEVKCETIKELKHSMETSKGLHSFSPSPKRSFSQPNPIKKTENNA